MALISCVYAVKQILLPSDVTLLEFWLLQKWLLMGKMLNLKSFYTSKSHNIEFWRLKTAQEQSEKPINATTWFDKNPKNALLLKGITKKMSCLSCQIWWSVIHSVCCLALLNRSWWLHRTRTHNIFNLQLKRNNHIKFLTCITMWAFLYLPLCTILSTLY